MRRSSPFTVTALVLVLLLAARGAAAAPPPPTAEELARHVAALTAPEMEGRGSGTEGGERAARYLESTLSAMGLKPGGDNGTWRQSFVVRRGVRAAPASLLAHAGGAPLAVGQEWLPHGGSPAGEVEGDVVFAGHGGDYTGMDVRGKIALVLEEGGTSRLAKVAAPPPPRGRARSRRVLLAERRADGRVGGDTVRHAHLERRRRAPDAERLDLREADPGERGGARRA